jgi:hypothetical protein
MVGPLGGSEADLARPESEMLMLGNRAPGLTGLFLTVLIGLVGCSQHEDEGATPAVATGGAGASDAGSRGADVAAASGGSGGTGATQPADSGAADWRVGEYVSIEYVHDRLVTAD